MTDTGHVNVDARGAVATVTFFHPKKNSLPGALLGRIADAIDEAGHRPDTNVVVLKSEGDGPFCAGASFDELLEVDTVEKGTEFFLGFARVILAIRRCPGFVLCRVQGKTVGGGVGIIAASDYAIASERAAIKLSEFALGFGPFVIGPAVARKIGPTAFAEASIDTEWRDAAWCRTHGLYAEVAPDTAALDAAVEKRAGILAASNPEAIRELKHVFWSDTEDWDDLLRERAGKSAHLLHTRFVKDKIAAVKGGG